MRLGHGRSVLTAAAVLRLVASQNTTQQVFQSTGIPPVSLSYIKLATWTCAGMLRSCQCDALVNAGFRDRLVMPTDATYEPNLRTYWSANARLRPWCILQPYNSREVADALTTLVHVGRGAGDWHIAVRSGGHSAQGTNNIDNGVTIDLSMMNHTAYDKVTGLAAIEPGARWMNVYADLAKYNVTASGGRDGDVGVGGFLTGGGNTFYAGRTGFGCDTVANFEVVLANGSIINANNNDNADLWRALKGGSSNFGIVTRFDVTTVPAQNLSYAKRIISTNHSDAFVSALVNYNSASNEAPDDAIIAFYTHQASIPGVIMILIEVNTRCNTNSTTFEELNRIQPIEATQIAESPAQAAAKGQLPGGTWNAGSTVTFKNDPRIVQRAVELHEQYVDFLTQRIGAENFTTECFFQPIPKLYGQIGRQHGGNMLGLPADDDVFIWTGGVGIATNAADLAVAHQGLRTMSAQITEFARSVDGHVDLVYLNYADTSQDPLGSYPPEDIQLIRDVALRYDPTAVFQERVPGGFKISRVS